MSFDTQNGAWLREERKRIGKTQQEMAERAGVRREMWSKYERGVAAPGAAVMKAMSEVGIDQQYVLTGRRVAESSIELAPDEQLLLDVYRELPPARRKALLASLLSGEDSAEGGAKVESSSSGKVSIKGSGHRVATHGGNFNYFGGGPKKK